MSVLTSERIPPQAQGPNFPYELGPNGKLDITRCSSYWLKDFEDRGIKHICWDGCMFPNATLENPDTWNAILKEMIGVVEG